MLKPTFDELVNTLNTFVGVQDQRPSKYSAIKVNGIRAYEYARKGIPVELPLRQIHVKHVELIAYGFPYFTVRVTCSGGTYIRSLLRDICISLGHTRNYDIFSTYSSGTFCYRFRKNSGRVNVTW